MQPARLRTSGRRYGRTRRAEVGVSGGRGVREGWCQMLLEPQPRALRPLHGSCECSWPVSGSVATLQKLRGETLHVNGKSTIFRACDHPNFAPCRDSPMVSSQNNSRCQCGLNGRPSCRRYGRTWRAKVGVSGGRGVRNGWCQMLPEPEPQTRAPRPFHGSFECSLPVLRSALPSRATWERVFISR